MPLASSEVPGCNWTTVWLTGGVCGMPLSAGVAVGGGAVGGAAVGGATWDDTAGAAGPMDEVTGPPDEPSAAKVPDTGAVQAARPSVVRKATANTAGRASMPDTPSPSTPDGTLEPPMALSALIGE
jgi:hypothetical protein